MPVRHGIDVAVWQGQINFDALPPLEFFCTQVGWTNLNNARDNGKMVFDPTYKRNVAEARKRGIPVIHYMVPVGSTPAMRQWEMWRDYIGPLPAGEGLMFDIEYKEATALGWPQLATMMDAAEVWAGRPVFHYGELFDQLDKPSRPKWPADYRKDRALMEQRYVGVVPLVIWQYTGSGTVPGISVATDENEILDFPRFKEAMGMAYSYTPFNRQAIPFLSAYNANRATGTPRFLVYHTIVNSGNVSAAAMRNTADASGGNNSNTKPTYYGDRDGPVYQIFGDDRQGACNAWGDRFVRDGKWWIGCSIETEDQDGTPIGPYTPAQAEGIAQMTADWCIRNAPALGLTPDALCRRPADPWSPGVGYHSMWGYNYLASYYTSQGKPVPNPWGLNYRDDSGRLIVIHNPWTRTVGKTCPALRQEKDPVPPGGDKISQHDGVLARARQIIAGVQPAPVPEEDDMSKLVQAPGTAEVWVTDFVTKRHVTSGDEAAKLIALLGATVTTFDKATVDKWPNVSAVPAGWTDHRSLAVAADCPTVEEIVDGVVAGIGEIHVEVPPVVFPNYGPVA